jgi:predicted dehydrogenase
MPLPKELAEVADPEENERLKLEAIHRLPFRISLDGGLDPRDFPIGMIGVGRIANQRQIPAYRNAGLRIAAVADLVPEIAEGTRDRWGVPQAFTDYRRLLDLKEVKVVDVLTNTFPRARIILDAIAAGKHVISEKPFVRSYAEGLSIVEAAEKAGVLLAIHQPTRQYYPFSMAKALIDAGYIGQPYFFEDIQHGNQDKVYYEQPVTRWHASLDDHLHVEWGAHHFDIARFLSGQTPTSVYCQGTRMPGQNFKSLMANAYTMEFDGVLRAVHVNNQVIQSGAADWSFRIDGTLGTIKLPAIVTDLELHSNRDGGTRFRFSWSWTESTTGINGLVGGHGAHMVDLLNAAFEGRQPLCNGRDNLQTVSTYLAAKRSAELGRPVSPREISA